MPVPGAQGRPRCFVIALQLCDDAALPRRESARLGEHCLHEIAVRSQQRVEMRTDQLPQCGRSVMFGKQRDHLARQRAAHAFLHHLVQQRILAFEVTKERSGMHACG